MDIEQLAFTWMFVSNVLFLPAGLALLWTGEAPLNIEGVAKRNTLVAPFFGWKFSYCIFIGLLNFLCAFNDKDVTENFKMLVALANVMTYVPCTGFTYWAMKDPRYWNPTVVAIILCPTESASMLFNIILVTDSKNWIQKELGQETKLGLRIFGVAALLYLFTSLATKKRWDQWRDETRKERKSYAKLSS